MTAELAASAEAIAAKGGPAAPPPGQSPCLATAKGGWQHNFLLCPGENPYLFSVPFTSKGVPVGHMRAKSRSWTYSTLPY